VTVTVQVRYDVRPYAAYDDPGLPIASYIAQGGLAGDASGGNAIISVEFQGEGDERRSELFNIEQLSIDTSAGVDQPTLMSTVSMDALARNRPASPQKWQMTTTTFEGESAIRLADTIGLPIFLGGPNLDNPPPAAFLRFQWDNINLRLYAITVQGFIWGPRSILAPGGPRRPIGGLFRA